MQGPPTGPMMLHRPVSGPFCVCGMAVMWCGVADGITAAAAFAESRCRSGILFVPVSEHCFGMNNDGTVVTAEHIINSRGRGFLCKKRDDRDDQQ